MRTSVFLPWVCTCMTLAGHSFVSATERWQIEAKPMDAQCRAFVEQAVASGANKWDEISLTEARVGFDSLQSLFGDGPVDVQATDIRLAGRIPVRVYRPAAGLTVKRAAVMYFHGGGWVLGNLATHDSLCRRLAKAAHCTVIAVDYRLAPEHPYPAPLDDCYDATVYVAEHSGEFGVDPQRLVVAGDSAGGNLAAAVAIRARDAGGPKILAQVLIYPALDAGCASESYRAFQTGHGLTAQDMRWFWRQYLGARKPETLATPSLLDDCARLPQAIIVTAEYDVLRDEAEAYARRLKAAGTPVRLHRHGGMIHGFLHFAGVIESGLVATSALGQELASCVAAGGQESEITLFDGKTLANWDGDPRFWRVEDGALVGETTLEKQAEKNTFLIYRGGEFTDFDLRFEYQVKNFNSGVQYRSIENGKWSLTGYQSDFEARHHNSDHGPIDRFSGMFFEEQGRMFLAQRGQSVIVRHNAENPKQPNIEVVGSVGDSVELEKLVRRDDWNVMRVIADGYHFTHLINGRVMSVALDSDEPNRRAGGLIGFQLHSGPAMQIRVRNLKIRPLRQVSP